MSERSARAAKGSLHVLLGGIIAAALGLLVFSLVSSMGNAASSKNDGTGSSVVAMWGLGILGVLVVVVCAFAATTPPVRPLEIAAARFLLDLEIPDAQAPDSWPSRGRGGLWLIVNVLIGGTVLFGLIYLLPIAVGLSLHPFGSNTSVRIPGLPAIQVGNGLDAWWVVALAPVPVVVAVVMLASATKVLRRTAFAFLGPTAADQLVLADVRELKLARDNALARDVHDSIGHALTAIGIQAEAASRLMERDPNFARSALEAIHETSTAAVEDLDRVLGVLTARSFSGDTNSARSGDLIEKMLTMIARAAPGAHFSYEEELTVLTAEAAAHTFRIVQESVTNAVKHGSEPPSVHMIVADTIQVTCSNATKTSALQLGHTAGRGLQGMHERALLAGGSVNVSHIDRTWTVLAEIPSGAAL